ncbi:MAG: flavodoxin domain-containing protein [Flexilinea sp.]
MVTKVLVTYASSYGSTQEIAEAVADTLRIHNLSVDLQFIKNIRTLDGYNAVVLGAPIYMFHWHKDVRNFLSRFKRVLEGGLPIAVFTSGPSFLGDEKEWQEVRSQVNQELTKYSWLKPVSVEIVGGRFDHKKLRFPYNFIPALNKLPDSDLRDWVAIRAWADLAGSLLIQAS